MLIALSNLLWDIYLPDITSIIPTEALTGLRNTLLPVETLTGILQHIPPQMIELESSGASPTNVAIAYAALGGKAAVIGPIADDPVGRKMRRDLDICDLSLYPLSPPPRHSGLCLCLHLNPPERSFLAAFPSYDTTDIAAPIDLSWQGAKWVVMSAYELRQAHIANCFLDLLTQAHAAGVDIAFDVGDPAFISAHADSVRRLLCDIGVRVLMLGEDALPAVLAVCGRNPSSKPDGIDLTDLAQIILLTRGNRGLTAISKGQIISPNIEPVEARDTTGAGDILLGTVLMALSNGNTLAQAVTRGIYAARAVVQVTGAHLSAADWQALRKTQNWQSHIQSPL
jgi:sugar/nucleoside kinase (ribokinase family)